MPPDKYPYSAYSWKLHSELIAEKKMDKSAFLYHGTGVPQEISHFFGIGPIGLTAPRHVLLRMGGKEFDGVLRVGVRNESIRLFWKSDLAAVIKRLFPNHYREYSKGKLTNLKPPCIRFERLNSATYEISFTGPSASGGGWTDAELEAAVKAYLQMLGQEARGESYSKAEANRLLRASLLRTRSKGSVDYRMANISAVLKTLGRPIIPGYLPMGNVGARTAERIKGIILKMTEATGMPSSRCEQEPQSPRSQTRAESIVSSQRGSDTQEKPQGLEGANTGESCPPARPEDGDVPRIGLDAPGQNMRQMGLRRLLLERIVIPPEDISLPINHFSISVRLRHVLYNAGYKILGNLHNCLYVDIFNLPNCGKKTILELKSLIYRICKAADPHYSLAVVAKPPVDEKYSIPSYAENWVIENLPISPRLINVFKKQGFRTLADVRGLRPSHLLRYRNCGRKSIKKFGEFLHDLRSGRYSASGLDFSERLKRLVASVDVAIDELKDKQRDVLLRRFGCHLPRPMTLAEIAAEYGQSKQLISQNESIAIKRIKAQGVGAAQETLRGIAEKCHSHVCPLTARLLADWMGDDAHPGKYPHIVYVRIFHKLYPKIPVWSRASGTRVKGGPNAREVMDGLEAVMSSARAPLQAPEVYRRLKEEGGCGGVGVGDFLTVLLQQNKFDVEPAQSDLLLIRPPLPRLKEICLRILNASDVSLTAEEIVEAIRLDGTYGRQLPSPRSLGNMLRDYYHGVYLLGPGRFGLKKHFRLPAHLWDKVKSDVYEWLARKGRPSAVYEMLKDACFEWAESTNAYEVAEQLREDGRFVDLGKLMFALQHWGVKERAYAKDVAVQVLRTAGHPLTAMELYSGITKLRSMTVTTMPNILRTDPRIRSEGFGYYGLVEWGGDVAKSFFAREAKLLDSIIKRAEPPISFSALCGILSIDPGADSAAEILWSAVNRLPGVLVSHRRDKNTATLIHKEWHISHILYSILFSAERPLSLEEVYWAFKDGFKELYPHAGMNTLKRYLQNHCMIVQDNTGEYMPHMHMERIGIDSDVVADRCRDVLCRKREIVGCEDLLERIKMEGVNVKNISPSMLGALLRSRRDLFEEVGRHLFRAAQ